MTKKVGSVDPLVPDGPPDNSLELATRLIEMERAQVGHEIHDALLPLIFAASAGVSSLADRDGADRERLRQIAAWLEDAMQTGRRLLTQVYPPELVDSVWTQAAKDTLERLFPQETSSIRWQVDSAINDLSRPTAFAAYRIVVEAVRNAIGHGKATEVTIEAQTKPSGFCVLIRDNGCGFEPAQVPQDRFGLRAMMGRAALVGGSLWVDSAPGGPTTITFEVGDPNDRPAPVADS